MALQDDIMSVLSGIGDAGDRLDDRGRRGEELYANISSILGDNPNYRKALRELTGLGSRPDMTLEEEMSLDPILGSKVADIIEKYMVDAETIGEVPDDMIVDDTRAAEQPIPTPEEFMGMAAQKRSVPDDMIVDDTRAAEAMMAAQERSVPDDMIVDDTRAAEAMMEADREAAIRAQDEGLAGLLAGQEAPAAGMLVGDAPTPVQTGGYRGEFAGTPGTSVGLNPVSDGRIPLKERLFAGQEAAGGPMSAGEQLMFASSFIPVAMLPAAAAKIGMGATQIARYLRAGKKGEDALRQVIRQRSGARMMRDPATGRMLGSKDVGPFQPQPTGTKIMRDPATGRMLGRSDVGPFTKSQELLNQAQRFRQGLPQPAFKQGGNIRNGIMRNYAMMSEGKSVGRHLGIKPKKGEPQALPKYQMYFPTSEEEISDIRDRLDKDKSYGRQIRKYLNPYYLSDVLSNMGKDD